MLILTKIVSIPIPEAASFQASRRTTLDSSLEEAVLAIHNTRFPEDGEEYEHIDRIVGATVVGRNVDNPAAIRELGKVAIELEKQKYEAELKRERIRRVSLKEEFSKKFVRRLDHPHLIKRPYRNGNIAGRKTELRDLSSRFEGAGFSKLGERLQVNTTGIQCVVGLGGIGKTRLALEYTYSDYAKKYDFIIWLDGVAGIAKGYRSVLNYFGVPEDDVRDADVLIWVKEVLEGKSKWLMVIDNIENPNDWMSHFPTQGGHILITSQKRHGWGDWVKVFELKELSLEHSVELLEKVAKSGRANRELSCSDSEKLAKLLTGLPLALVLVGAYLGENGLVEVNDYIADFDAHVKRSLGSDSPTDYEKTIYTCWQISRDKIGEPARRALERCAYYAPEGIPECLLTSNLTREDQDRVRNSLKSYSIIRVSERRKGRGLYSMHQLVQTVIQGQLKVQQRERIMIQRAFEEIKRAFSDDETTCILLVSHLFSILNNLDKISRRDESWIRNEEYAEFKRRVTELTFEMSEKLIKDSYFDTAKKLFLKLYEQKELWNSIDSTTQLKLYRSSGQLFQYTGTRNDYEYVKQLYEDHLKLIKERLDIAIKSADSWRTKGGDDLLDLCVSLSKDLAAMYAFRNYYNQSIEELNFTEELLKSIKTKLEQLDGLEGSVLSNARKNLNYHRACLKFYLGLNYHMQLNFKKASYFYSQIDAAAILKEFKTLEAAFIKMVITIVNNLESSVTDVVITPEVSGQYLADVTGRTSTLSIMWFLNIMGTLNFYLGRHTEIRKENRYIVAKRRVEETHNFLMVAKSVVNADHEERWTEFFKTLVQINCGIFGMYRMLITGNKSLANAAKCDLESTSELIKKTPELRENPVIAYVRFVEAFLLATNLYPPERSLEESTKFSRDHQVYNKLREGVTLIKEIRGDEGGIPFVSAALMLFSDFLHDRRLVPGTKLRKISMLRFKIFLGKYRIRQQFINAFLDVYERNSHHAYVRALNGDMRSKTVRYIGKKRNLFEMMQSIRTLISEFKEDVVSLGNDEESKRQRLGCFQEKIKQIPSEIRVLYYTFNTQDVDDLCKVQYALDAQSIDSLKRLFEDLEM